MVLHFKEALLSRRILGSRRAERESEGMRRAGRRGEWCARPGKHVCGIIGGGGEGYVEGGRKASAKVSVESAVLRTAASCRYPGRELPRAL